jgi:hypothetical protein
MASLNTPGNWAGLVASSFKGNENGRRGLTLTIGPRMPWEHSPPLKTAGVLRNGKQLAALCRGGANHCDKQHNSCQKLAIFSELFSDVY